MKRSAVRLSSALFLGVAQIWAQNAATSVSVDANANRHTINPNIYGVCYGDAHDMAALNAPLNRWGGNSTTRYNWQIDAHSAAADWYFETYSDGSGTPGGSADAYVATTRSAGNGAEPMFTIPMIDYVANLGPGRTTLEGFSVKKYGAQTAVDPWNSDAGNGVSAATGNDITGNNPLDTGVVNSTAIQQAWVQHFVSTLGTAATTTGIKYYILDNEPSIWYSTHRDVYPNPATYQEMYNKIVAYAAAIRAADPSAKIAGFEEWGWWAMYLSGFDQANGSGAASSDYNTHNQTYYYPWLLQQLYAYQQKTGTSLIDILTVHAYNATPDGSDDSLAGQQTRNRETRILWDPNFQDPSWYGDIGINGRVLNWIPTLKAMVAQYYPGLQIGSTEYNWGDEPNLNGATTQADVLGIYGREGFDLATRWTVAKNTSTTPTTYYVTYLASQIYRNYDGNNSTFGNTSVAATVANPDNLSAFAALRSSDGALTVMVINKQQGSTPVTVSLANFPTTGTAQAWQINSAAQTSIARLADVTVANNAITATAPSQSITLFVVPAGSVLSPPTAPTGLAAAVGNGTVTVTWNAGGGATSYTVQRASVSGGPYTSLGTVTSPSPTSYADSGLTNGTTYYYVVSASNQAGTSPNSTELAATPIVPPTFTSSATAAPNPVTQGNSTIVTATVTDTANTLVNGIVRVLAVDPGGNTVASQNFPGQNFSLNQSQNYPLTFTPASSGTFSVQVGVFSATGQQWHWNNSAASIAVNSPLSFSSSATATPSSVAPGAPTVIAFTVTDTGTASLTNGNVEMQVFDSNSNAVATNIWSGQNFTGGLSQPYSYTWNVPGSQATGTYTVMIGVFDGSWTTDYYWNSNGATITVAAAQLSAPAAPKANPASAITSGGFTANWSQVTGATDYRLDVSTDSSFGSFVAGYQNLDVGNVSQASVTGLTAGTVYYYRVRAYNSGGAGNNSGSITVATNATIVITTPLTVSTLAGEALTEGSSDGVGTGARFIYPSGVAVDSAGNLYLADTDNDTIRKVAVATGTVTTLAGLAGSSGSADGAGSAARFNSPSGVAVDSAGDVYVADTLNDTVRKVTSAGVVSTLAGTPGASGSVDDAGSAARFQGPQGLAIDGAGSLYVADTNNQVIRKVVPATGAVTTVAGLAGSTGSSDGLGSAARFNLPTGVAVDAAGNLYVADADNDTIREIQPSGLVSTLAGLAGYSGSADGTGSAARFDSPSALAVDASGHVFVADSGNFTIRQIVIATGATSTLAGLAGTSGSVDGIGSAVRFYQPAGIAADDNGDLYIADTDNDLVRLGIMPAAPAIQSQPQSQTATTGASAQFSVTASGRPAPTYQWYFNGTAISGAIGSSYSLTGAQSGNAGSYTVVVTNAMGSVTSDPATLTVNAAAPPTGGAGGGNAGGGGGGAASPWFLLALALMVVVRAWVRKPGILL